jgi:hypothetical protein
MPARRRDSPAISQRPSPAVLERLRANVEARLLRGYDIGAKQALDAIEASTKQPDSEA